MTLSRYIKDGLSNLFASPLRSILALLGILVGTASVVAMVSSGQLATNEALKQFKTLGTDLLAITLNDSDEQNDSSAQSNITLPQIDNMHYVDKNIQDIAPYIQLFNPLEFNNQNINGSILGVTDRFANIIHVAIESGRFISPWDDRAAFCVIGNKIYQQIRSFFFMDPIGQQIKIGNTYFTIIGIAKSWPENSFVYANIDNTVLIPILTASTLSQYASINNIILRIAPETNIEKIQGSITQYVHEQWAHKTLFFRSAKELIVRMTKQSHILTIFLGLIGSISLFVGGIGIMNIMLVSVMERRHEIGIRLAVGAKRSHIRTLFLMEAIILSLVGGILGVIIGILITTFIAFFWHWQFILTLWPPLTGFSVAVITGAFFGYYPAYKASQCDPIQALRSA